MSKLSLLAVFVMSVATTACASAPRSEGSGAARTVRRSADQISEEELRRTTASNALQAVQVLRPDWLRSRGAASMRDPMPAELVVYLDGIRFGNLAALEQFPIGTVKSLRYYSATEATNRWGTGHGGGVIVVTTK